MTLSISKSFRNSILVLLGCLAFLTVGCDTRPISEDPLDEGIQKIDEGSYDEAIAYLEDLQTRDSRPEVKIALSTAYVGRSGVEFADYWEIVRIMQADPVTDESIRQDSRYTENKERVEPINFLLSSTVRESLDQLFQATTAFRIYLDRVQILPYVEASRRPDLERGIEVLNSVTTPGSRFYRAVLVITLLRSDLDDGFDVWDSIESRLQRALTYPLEAPTLFCSPVTGDFTEWLLKNFRYADLVSQDLQAAFPSDSEDFKSFSESVQSLQQEIPDIQESLIPRGCP